MKQNVHFDTFFIKIGQKWEGAAQTTELEEGVQGGSENYYLCYYLSFTPILTNVEADMYVFQVKASIL